jgi:hypothetical protein
MAAHFLGLLAASESGRFVGSNLRDLLGDARFRHILHKGTISESAGRTAKEGTPSSE